MRENNQKKPITGWVANFPSPGFKTYVLNGLILRSESAPRDRNEVVTDQPRPYIKKMTPEEIKKHGRQIKRPA